MKIRGALAVPLLALWPLLAFAQTTPDPEPSVLARLFVQYVLPALGTVLAMAITALGALAVKWLNAKTGNAQAAAFAQRLFALAQDAVAHVDAQVKAGVVAASADGQLTQEEIKRLQTLALQALRQWAGPNLADQAHDLLGIGHTMLDAWLMGLIQKAFSVKPEKTMWPSKAPQILVSSASATPPIVVSDAPVP